MDDGDMIQEVEKRRKRSNQIGREPEIIKEGRGLDNPRGADGNANAASDKISRWRCCACLPFVRACVNNP